jgi:biotin carboxyl carrier protein
VTVAVAFNGEELRGVLERIIVSPAAGTFRSAEPELVTAEGEVVRCGQVVGVVEASGDDVPVCSAFDGWMMGMLAMPGERVREGQPIAWLRRL